MAEETVGGSKTSSPAKSGWVSFDEDATDGGGSGRVNGETSSTTAKGSSPSSPSTGPTSSGVSSARGSVNSISRSNYDPSSPGALQVSEIQVLARHSGPDTVVKGHGVARPRLLKCNHLGLAFLSHFESDCFRNGLDVEIGHFKFDPEKQLIVVLDVSASAHILEAILYRVD